jgi:hypothetical protein
MILTLFVYKEMLSTQAEWPQFVQHSILPHQCGSALWGAAGACCNSDNCTVPSLEITIVLWCRAEMLHEQGPFCHTDYEKGMYEEYRFSRASVAHAWNPSYLGGWDWEDQSSKPAQANSSLDPISKITSTKWTGDTAQAVECLLFKCEAPSSNPSPTKNMYIDRFNAINNFYCPARTLKNIFPISLIQYLLIC